MLLTVDELGTWAGVEVDPSDPWAIAVMTAASNKVRSIAEQPTWTRTTAPARAREIACHLAARSFLNRTAVSREGVGPISESRVEELSRTMHLTEAEEKELVRLAPDPAAAGGTGGALWIQPLHVSTPLADDTIIVSGMRYADPGDSYAFTPLA